MTQVNEIRFAGRNGKSKFHMCVLPSWMTAGNWNTIKGLEWINCELETIGVNVQQLNSVEVIFSS